MRATTDEALGLIDELYPSAWKEAAKTADFDVIAATLDRLQAAAATGDWKQAETARLEAYGVFELGPEQRLRGLAPSLFQEVEGYFWYGAGGHDGLVQTVRSPRVFALDLVTLEIGIALLWSTRYRRGEGHLREPVWKPLQLSHLG